MWIRSSRRTFGLYGDYVSRLNKKMSGTHYVPETPQFFVSNSRPGNFGNHLDIKVCLDNWFEDNRIHNEDDVTVKKTQTYIMNALFYGSVLAAGRVLALGVIGRLVGWTRYDRDTYMEYDIGALPPGEVFQVVWNGIPVFIRRVTQEELDHEENSPKETILDTKTKPNLNDAGKTKVLVCSAVCTHLGCIPIPYMGAYKGWVCICHGSVFDKIGRVRQGPALDNLRAINNSLYGNVLCLEEMKFPREPTTRFWA